MRDYQNLVFTTASRLLGSDSEAEDICQEVFLRAYQHFEEISGSPTAGGWLKTVTRNLCLNYLSRYRYRWRFFSEFFSKEEEDPPFEVAAPETLNQELDLAHQRHLLEVALQKLPRSQRVPLVLYHFEELSYEEIAETLGVSLGKVKTDIFRGRKTLREKLQSLFTEGISQAGPQAGSSEQKPNSINSIFKKSLCPFF